MDINTLINSLLYYAKKHLSLNSDDEIYIKNQLLHIFKVDNPLDTDIDKKAIDEYITPDVFSEAMKEYFLSLGYSSSDVDKLITQVYGILTPLPSVINKTFFDTYKLDPIKATDNFYDLCIKNDYVKKSLIDKNIVMNEKIDGHDLVVTINLSKPEKNNKDVRKEKEAKATNYPKCMICYENEGCFGSLKTPPRNNLRVINLKLNNQEWFMQYSPYGYYKEHLIVILKKHVPLAICQEYLGALYDFVDMFPHYFLGSNAALPIVGGSILSHEHFQGGRFTFPIMKSKTLEEIDISSKDVKAFSLDYPAFCIKLVSKDKKASLEETYRITEIWKKYSREDLGFVAYDKEEHNTSTIIVRKVDDNYETFILFRNNCVDDKHPEGLFHVRNEYLPIKKEGIGLIEAMGLFVLPARLKRQLKALEDIVDNKISYEQALEENPDIDIFKPLLNDVINHKYESVHDLLVKACNAILSDIAPLKTKEDRDDFFKLLKK